MSNWKVQRVQPGQPVEHPYIKGTEAPNYYLVLGETGEVIYGFRPLAVAVPPIGSEPQNGVQTRLRVVPKDQEDYTAFKKALGILDFEERNYGDGLIHFSMVTSSAATVISKLEKLLALSGCFEAL